MAYYVSPKGDRIVGTSERVWATAEIEVESDGTWSYAGGSEVHWDTQEPATRDGSTLFMCESGHEWTEDQITLVRDIEEAA
jgi:hypothetical protein